MTEQPIRAIGVLGLGRLGRSLSVSLRKLDYEVHDFERLADESHEAGRQRLAEWARKCQALCLCVRDDQIAEAVANLDATEIEGKWVLIHSGVTPLSSLQSLAERGAAIAKLHPLQSFSKVIWQPIPANTHFAFEGDGEDLARQWVDRWQGVFHRLQGEQWQHYHLAAVLAANFLPLWIRAGAETLSPFADSLDDALAWLTPLIQRSVAAGLDPELALPFSGPAVRGDEETLAVHERLLGQCLPEMVEPYRQMSTLVREKALERQRNKSSKLED